MSRNFRSRSRRWSGQAGRAPLPGAEHRPGRVFVLRADLISAETRDLLASVARVVLPAQRGRLFEQLERIVEPVGARESRAEADRSPVRGDAGTAARARPRILQRTRRLRARRTGICDGPRAGPIDACAVDQRHRQSDVRLPGGSRGRRLHLVGQQPREPDHAVVERSGQRSTGRGVLSAGRRHRRPVDARRRCRSATSRRPMSPATAAATAASSMSRTRSRPICFNTCRSTIRSRFRASC